LPVVVERRGPDRQRVRPALQRIARDQSEPASRGRQAGYARRAEDIGVASELVVSHAAILAAAMERAAHLD
jgi:hypothetical protein